MEFVRRQADHLQLALAAESQPGQSAAHVYGTLLMHVAVLVQEIDPDIDERIVAGFVLNAVAPQVLHQMRTRLDADTAALQASARALLRGFTPPTDRDG